MTLTGIPTDLQNLLILNYESEVKVLLLVGWWFFALIYLMFWYKRQQPTKYFLVGTIRAILYIMSFIYAWSFWILYAVFKHPNVPIDNLLIFLAWSYTAITTVMLVLFLFNFLLWIPKAVLTFGKFDITGWEDHAVKEYFGSFKKDDNWFKRK